MQGPRADGETELVGTAYTALAAIVQIVGKAESFEF
jgi:hypothetical protein